MLFRFISLSKIKTSLSPVLCIGLLTSVSVYANEEKKGDAYGLDIQAILSAEDPVAADHVAEEEMIFPDIDFSLDEEVDGDPVVSNEVLGVQESIAKYTEEIGNAVAMEKPEYMDEVVDPHGELSEEIEAEHVVGVSRSNIAAEEKVDDHMLKNTVEGHWRSNIEKALQQARVARKILSFQEAEEYYIDALNHEMEKERRVSILLEMADFFESRGIVSKTVAVLEKFLELYPAHEKSPEINMRLGYIYRDIGAYHVALERFFEILHMSLAVGPNNFKEFKKLAKRAQVEIAHTHFIQGDYAKAVKHYNRLKLDEMNEEDQKWILFRGAYSSFEQKDYTAVLSKLELFLQKFKDSKLAPEAHYILASAYKALNKESDTVREVKRLLHHDLARYPESRSLWEAWQEKTANKLANEFYEQGDYMNALKIYQAMVPVNRSAEWQWPIIYQIGLCFEQLGMYPKAHQAYTVILDSTEWEIDLSSLSDTLSSVKEMAAWRQDHLKWIINSEFKLRQLIRPTTADIIAL